MSFPPDDIFDFDCESVFDLMDSPGKADLMKFMANKYNESLIANYDMDFKHDFIDYADMSGPSNDGGLSLNVYMSDVSTFDYMGAVANNPNGTVHLTEEMMQPNITPLPDLVTSGDTDLFANVQEYENLESIDIANNKIIQSDPDLFSEHIDTPGRDVVLNGDDDMSAYDNFDCGVLYASSIGSMGALPDDLLAERPSLIEHNYDENKMFTDAFWSSPAEELLLTNTVALPSSSSSSANSDVDQISRERSDCDQGSGTKSGHRKKPHTSQRNEENLIVEVVTPQPIQKQIDDEEPKELEASQSAGTAVQQHKETKRKDKAQGKKAKRSHKTGIWIYNISEATNACHLRTLFKLYSPVLLSKIVTDGMCNYGYILLDNEDLVDLATRELDGIILDGQMLELSSAKPGAEFWTIMKETPTMKSPNCVCDLIAAERTPPRYMQETAPPRPEERRKEKDRKKRKHRQVAPVDDPLTLRVSEKPQEAPRSKVEKVVKKVKKHNRHDKSPADRKEPRRPEPERPVEKKDDSRSDRLPERQMEKRDDSRSDRVPERPVEKRDDSRSDRAPERPAEKRDDSRSDRLPERHMEKRDDSRSEKLPERPMEKRDDSRSDRVPERPVEKRDDIRSDRGDKTKKNLRPRQEQPPRRLPASETDRFGTRKVGHDEKSSRDRRPLIPNKPMTSPYRRTTSRDNHSPIRKPGAGVVSGREYRRVAEEPYRLRPRRQSPIYYAGATANRYNSLRSRSRERREVAPRPFVEPSRNHSDRNPTYRPHPTTFRYRDERPENKENRHARRDRGY